MKNSKSLCAAVVLTLVLTLPVFAGEMTTMIADPPPPPTATEGQMQTGDSEAVDPVAQLALNVLQSVLSLF
jgi:hypothetical protein